MKINIYNSKKELNYLQKHIFCIIFVCLLFVLGLTVFFPDVIFFIHWNLVDD